MKILIKTAGQQVFATLILLNVSYAPAAAEDLVFDMDQTVTCLDRTDVVHEQRACVGASAEACMEATPGGYSTVGMGACLEYEYEYWDGRLNDAYRVLLDSERADDLEWGQPVKKADALRDMQRAWIAYRDATCDYERSQWGGGTGGSPATAACLMRLTGEQALYLEGAMAEG